MEDPADPTRAWLLRVASRWAGEQDGEDLAHDAWVAAAASKTPGGGRGWWSGVVRNRWKMRVRADARRRAREALREDGAFEHHSPDPERSAAQRDVARILQHSLRSLDPLDRRIVVLRHCDGCTSAEIAAEVSLPAATVRTRLRRALERMRTDLDARWGSDSKPWQWALLPAISSTPTPTAAALVGGRWLLWVVLGAVSVSVVAWIATAGRDAASNPSAAASSVPSDPPAPKAGVQRWSAKRNALREARRARLASLGSKLREPDATDDAAAALEGLFFDDAARASKPLLRALGKQVSETLRECARNSTFTAGVLTVRAQLIAEPDIGTIVESVIVKRDTVGDPDLLECVRESSYTYAFPEPDRALYLAHDFTVDMGAEQVAAAAVLPLDELPDVLERYPAYLDALPAVLEQVPPIAKPMRTLVERDPSLRERLPRFVELIGAEDPAEP